MTLASTFRDNKAFYTVAGAGDLAAEKLREMPEQVGRARESVDRYQGEVRGNLDKYRDQVRETVGRYRGELRDNVGRLEVREVPGAAVSYVTQVGTRTAEFIDELAERGKKVVHREAAEVAEITERPAPKSRPAQRRKPAQSRTRTGTAAKKSGS
ncbi:hypothetical protein [Actinomadura rugatobispora]|uniref:Heparin-binding hemagglutinin n=1 Tax=Actinomadura rugatobispora TaxID=1994 RepID=A0ABW0ZUD0_9ACTN|nr:hypothetical protein GCM10010200_051010 [Actinomadura rugatobispora]